MDIHQVASILCSDGPLMEHITQLYDKIGIDPPTFRTPQFATLYDLARHLVINFKSKSPGATTLALAVHISDLGYKNTAGQLMALVPTLEGSSEAFSNELGHFIIGEVDEKEDVETAQQLRPDDASPESERGLLQLETKKQREWFRSLESYSFNSKVSKHNNASVTCKIVMVTVLLAVALLIGYGVYKTAISNTLKTGNNEIDLCKQSNATLTWNPETEISCTENIATVIVHSLQALFDYLTKHEIFPFATQLIVQGLNICEHQQFTSLFQGRDVGTRINADHLLLLDFTDIQYCPSLFSTMAFFVEFPNVTKLRFCRVDLESARSFIQELAGSLQKCSLSEIFCGGHELCSTFDYKLQILQNYPKIVCQYEC